MYYYCCKARPSVSRISLLVRQPQPVRVARPPLPPAAPNARGEIDRFWYREQKKRGGQRYVRPKLVQSGLANNPQVSTLPTWAGLANGKNILFAMTGAVLAAFAIEAAVISVFPCQSISTSPIHCSGRWHVNLLRSTYCLRSRHLQREKFSRVCSQCQANEMQSSNINRFL